MHSNQRGGIVSFIVVGVVLVGLLAGGLYVSKHQARVARDTDTSGPQIATKDTTGNKKADPKVGTVVPGSADTKQGSVPQTTAPTQVQGSKPQTPTTPSTEHVANTGPSEPLPSTGPGETGLVTVVLSILAFTGYRFVQTRRDMRRAALRR